METSGTAPFDIRLPAPAGRPPGTAVAAVPVGAVLIAAPLAAIATQGLHPLDRLDALLLALAGLVILGWGVLQVAGPRPRLQHTTDVTLDGVGVAVGGADVTALLTWPDVSVVEVSWWEIVPPYVEEACHLPVLRFVPQHDGDVTLRGTPGISADLAQSFGITPAAAALTVVIGPRSIELLQALLDWIGANRPDVPVELGAPPEL